MQAVIGMLTRYGYAVVFGLVFAEQVGLPIPAIPFSWPPAAWREAAT